MGASTAGSLKPVGIAPDGSIRFVSKRVTRGPHSAAVRPAIDTRPIPRPQIVRKDGNRPKVLQNTSGAKGVGALSQDARWSAYGAYLQQMIDTIDVQWHAKSTQLAEAPTPGTRVVVKFQLTYEGRIARIVSVDSTASDFVNRSCVNAITDRAPYGKWTDEMRSVLGEVQELSFTFHYQ